MFQTPVSKFLFSLTRFSNSDEFARFDSSGTYVVSWELGSLLLYYVCLSFFDFLLKKVKILNLYAELWLLSGFELSWINEKLVFDDMEDFGFTASFNSSSPSISFFKLYTFGVWKYYCCWPESSIFLSFF